MAWIRIDTDMFHRLRRLDNVTLLSVMAVIAYVKDHGARGVVTATPDDIAAVKYVPEENVRLALQLDMFKVDGQTIQVLEWQDFQIDPTNSKRQKKHREGEDKSNGNERDVTLRNVTTVSNDYTDTDTDTYTDNIALCEIIAEEFEVFTEHKETQNHPMNVRKFAEMLKTYSPEVIREAMKRAGPKTYSPKRIESFAKVVADETARVSAADAEAKRRIAETQKLLDKEKADYEARLQAERQTVVDAELQKTSTPVKTTGGKKQTAIGLETTNTHQGVPNDEEKNKSILPHPGAIYGMQAERQSVSG